VTRITRRGFLAGGAATALGAVGVYELVDRLAGSAPARPAGKLLAEQHLLEGVRLVHQDGVEVLVPPLHHQVVTARITADPRSLRDAQQHLESVLTGLEDDYAPTPAGLGVTVAWGLPYFDRLVGGQARRHLPYDRRAAKPALLAARRFPSDPAETVLEQNDVAVLLRSDVRAHIDDAVSRLRKSSLLHVTSLRAGFAGGGFEGGTSLPKTMAVAANVPGADLIPDTSELFLGFTSTQAAAFGPGKIANFETLGLVDLRGSDYFANGTHMHLSHVTEDLEAWYINFDFDERVTTAFRPGLQVEPDVQTVAQGPEQAQTAADVRRDFHRTGRIGHSASIQVTSRLAEAKVGPDGTHYPKGTAIPIRADFNTLDNPFAYSDNPEEIQDGPAAGIHFLVFNPSSDDFHRNRLAMDGVLPDGTLPLEPRDRNQGFNAVLRTTHRQNFLVPPRRHRSFPLAELRV
jgi:hypothetical protein